MQLHMGIHDNYTLDAAGLPTLTFVPALSAVVFGALTTLVYSAAPVMDVSLSNNFVMTITDAVAFVIGAPTNPRTGQVLRLKLRNTSGGAHGAGTYNAVFKTANVPAIATANSRTFEWIFDGTNWVNSFASAADVAN